MRLDFRQNLGMQQQMKLAPRIIQAMEVLQLPMMALQERIDAEMEANPVLEMDMTPQGEQEYDLDGGEVAESQSADDDGFDERAMVVSEDNHNFDDFQRLANFSDEYGEEAVASTASANGEDAGDRKIEAMSNMPAGSESLDEYLLRQWSLMEIPPSVRTAGELIIQNLDNDGYLRVKLSDLVGKGDVPMSADVMTKALECVQTLEPAGVGARDIRECLLLQLAQERVSGRDVKLEIELVRQHLREIEKNHLPLIARRTGKSIEQINAAIQNLSHLNPRPGLLVAPSFNPIINPDVIVSMDENGDPVVTMADGNAPRLFISDEYRQLARDRKTDRDAKLFLQKNIRSAKWIIEAIKQRKYTIQRVAQEIFNAQKDFLHYGQEALKPLPMAVVAEKVNIHVATVSRAVAGKYAQTPRGIYPLRMFFSGGTQSEQGEDVAWDAVKAKLREVVDAEDKSTPLSDDQIAAELTKQGVRIARRTVAKYRKILNIAPARKRKQF